MDDAMMEYSVSNLMDVFLILEHKTSKIPSQRDFDIDAFLKFGRKSGMWNAYDTKGVQETRIRLEVNKMLQYKLMKHFDLE